MIEVEHTPYYGYGPNCYHTREHDFVRLDAICSRSQIKLNLVSCGVFGAYFRVRENHDTWFRLLVDVRSK